MSLVAEPLPERHLRLLRPHQHVSDRQACRLCLENARFEQEPGRAPDVAAASKDSQQLFFANMVFKRRVTPLPDYVRWDHRWSTKNKNQLPCQPGTSFDDHALEQLTLFDMHPDPRCCANASWSRTAN